MAFFITPQVVTTPVFTLNNTKTFTGNNTTVNTPIFRITGNVRVLKLYGVITTNFGSNHTGASFRLNDQTAQTDITDTATGTVLSSLLAGTTILKSGLKTAIALLMDNATGVFKEPTTLETVEFTEFVVEKKTGANTDIEYRYATTNTPTSGAMQFFVEYQPLSADGALTAL